MKPKYQDKGQNEKGKTGTGQRTENYYEKS
jgi:hypothetical protein